MSSLISEIESRIQPVDQRNVADQLDSMAVPDAGAEIAF
jgi:hypothetical protein